MEPSLATLLTARWGDDWLIGPDSEKFWAELKGLAQPLAIYAQSVAPHSPTLLIAEPNPLKFLAAFLAAHRAGCSVYLANPHWGQGEWGQVKQIAQPRWSTPIQAGWGCYPCDLPRPNQATEILIPTGGSSGGLKFASHRWDTLMASVQGFRAHFSVEMVHAYCVLPLYHVGGLMQGLRVLASGGTLAIQSYKELKQGQILALPRGGFLSLVPTQLQPLLDQGDPYLHWLRGFQAVLLGGAPAWSSLLQQARAAGLPLALTYGMTETASQVATLLPEEFLEGHTSSGRPLPQAKISIRDCQGQLQPPGQQGTVVVESACLARGYVGATTFLLAPVTNASTPGPFYTDDVGYLDGAGYLHIVGRRSAKIITGGENVFPEEVEAVLLALDAVEDICVVGLPDAHWGQQVVALVAMKPGETLDALGGEARSRLSPFKLPKQWILVPAIPRTTQGKISRRQALELALRILGLPP